MMQFNRNRLEKMLTRHSSSRSCWRSLAGWAAVTAGLLLPSVVQAQYSYTTNNNTITITGYSGAGGALVITNLITDLPVTSIGTNAFQSNTNLTSVTIPTSVTNIANSAFYACNHLQSITIPDSVTSLGNYVFAYCTSLTNVTIPSGVTILGVEAFYACAHLTTILFPPNVANIGVNAFSYCTRLTDITIPASVTNIGLDVFYDCASMDAITVDPNNPAYSSLAGLLYDKNQTTLIQCPAGRAGPVTIPGTVTNIMSSAFFSCANLTGVTIGTDVTSIGVFAFYECTSLTNVTIPARVTSLGTYAFYGCTNLTGVYFQGNAPTGVSSSSVFSNDTQALIYYLPGATGFGPTIGGRATVVWQATLVVAASPANGGVASGGGTYGVGSNVQITATANSGWTFTGWSDGHTQTPRTITVPADGATYTANFMNATGGSIATAWFAGTNGLYDLTGVLTNLTEDFVHGSSSTTTISEAVMVVQALSGAVSGHGTTTAAVVTSETGSFTFPAAYTLKGTVKSAGQNVRISNAFTGKGSDALDGVTYQFSEALLYLVTLNPSAATMTGRITGTATATGKGPHAGTSKIVDTTFGPAPSTFPPVGWQLSLTFTANHTKVAGTAAFNLANGRSFPLPVTGTLKNGVFKLTLAGTGASKGAKLTVIITGTTMTGMTGSLLGQKINLTQM